MRATDRIGHQLKLRDLHIFMTVVSAGSMGKAAERLNTVQPAVSRSIAELEKTLGVRLLDRNRQGVEPTEYGRSLLQCGVAVFDDLRQGVKNIEFLSDPTVGEVRVGSSPFLSASFVAAVIDRVSRRYPGIACRLVSARAETLKRDLGERSVELVIAPMLDSFDAERLEFEPLYEDTFVVVAGAQNPLVRRRNVKFRDLMDEPWVLAAVGNSAWLPGHAGVSCQQCRFSPQDGVYGAVRSKDKSAGSRAVSLDIRIVGLGLSHQA